MAALKSTLPPLPDRMRALPIDPRGYPIPAFVAMINGAPDFRVIEKGFVVKAITKNLCWICGDNLGVHKAFTIGPMCTINRLSSEPPAHLSCAEFAVRACPFMLNPDRDRRDINLPTEVHVHPAAFPHNPGVMAIWVCKTYSPFDDADNVLCRLGDAESITWWTRGRLATGNEVIAAIEAGVDRVIQQCDMSEDQVKAYRSRAFIAKLKYAPKTTPENLGKLG